MLNDSLMPKANLVPSEKRQLRKEVSNQGGAVGSSLPLRSLEEHRQHKTKTAIGQQALPKARPKHKKVGKTKASKLELEKTNFLEKMQLALLEVEDPRASLDQDTGKQLSLRIILIFSLMNKWQLKTTRIHPAWPQEHTKIKLRELGLKESLVDSEVLVGNQLVVFQHGDSLLIGGEKMQQECFFTKLSASFNPIETQQLDEHTPLSFLHSQLELNQADRSISLHPTTQFYSESLDRHSLEDAKGGETPTIELDQRASRWKTTILDAKRSEQSVGKLVWLSLLRPDVAFAVHTLSRSLSKPTENDEEYIKSTQTYTVSLKTPRKWKRAKNLELLAFSTAWGETSRQATCVSLFFMGVHLAASIQQQATTRAAADLISVRSASNLACHTKILLQNMMLEKPLLCRVLTRGPVAQKLGLSKQTRHIELSRSQLGQFQLSKVQPKQNLAEQLANKHTACSLHRLLPKLQMQARPAGKLALPTVRGEGRAFNSSSLGSFYIGMLRRASAMEKPCSEQLLGKELEKNLVLPELDSAFLSETSLHADELVAAYATESLQQQSLQPEELEAAYLSSRFQNQSLQQRELSAAYATDELERTALTLSSLQQKELGRFKTFQQDSSTRASDAKPDAFTSSTRASNSDAKPDASH